MKGLITLHTDRNIYLIFFGYFPDPVVMWGYVLITNYAFAFHVPSAGAVQLSRLLRQLAVQETELLREAMPY